MPMTDEEIKQFLDEKRIGVLGVNRQGEPPQLIPIWFRYDGDVIWMMSEKQVSKIDNIREDPQVSLCVDDETFPYRAVVAYGTVELVEENVQETRRALARRYLGDAAGEAYAAEPRPRGTILLKLVPDRFYSSGNSRGRTT